MTTQPRRGRPSNRDRVLAAATAVALREGPGAVTIEAVVAESGLSRGGVLYHFPSKAELLQALVDQDIEAMRAVSDVDPTSSPASPGEHIRAYYDACTAWEPERGRIALAVALAEDPSLLQTWATVQRELDKAERVETTLDGEPTATGEGQESPRSMALLLARLAFDGLWFSDLIDPDRFSPEQRARLVEAIIAMAEEER